MQKRNNVRWLLICDAYNGITIHGYSTQEKAEEGFRKHLNDIFDEDKMDEEDRQISLDECKYEDGMSQMWLAPVGCDDDIPTDMDDAY